MQFTDRLFTKVAPVWQSYLEHPFVKGIGDGTLAHDKFIHYMKQDYIYLIEYARVFALGAAKANDLKTMTLFANLLHGTMNFEMDLHRDYAKQFGITPEELEATEPSATMTSYTSYMLSQAQLGGVENTIAAVLACAWSYHWIGTALAKIPNATSHEFYGNWVRMYASEEFSALANDTIAMMNDVARDLPEHKLQQLETIFITTCYYEYLFWEMAETKAMWPLPALAHH
ncbi:MAG TPA: thiaminase II [Metalysinibacillus sp.]